MQPRQLDARQGGLQVHQARAFEQGATKAEIGPFEKRHFALDIRIRKAHFGDGSAQARTVFFPIHICGQLGKGENGFGEPACQIHAAIGHGQVHAPATLGEVKVQVQALKTRPCVVLCRQRCLAGTAFYLVRHGVL